jgi:hypothetical protein
VIAFDGRDTDWYWDPERERTSVLLAIVAGQIVEDDLNDHVGEPAPPGTTVASGVET